MSGGYRGRRRLDSASPHVATHCAATRYRGRRRRRPRVARGPRPCRGGLRPRRGRAEEACAQGEAAPTRPASRGWARVASVARVAEEACAASRPTRPSRESPRRTRIMVCVGPASRPKRPSRESPSASPPTPAAPGRHREARRCALSAWATQLTQEAVQVLVGTVPCRRGRLGVCCLTAIAVIPRRQCFTAAPSLTLACMLVCAARPCSACLPACISRSPLPCVMKHTALEMP